MMRKYRSQSTGKVLCNKIIIGREGQGDMKSLVEEIYKVIEEVRSQALEPAREWVPCPWFEKLVGANRNPEANNHLK
jgi:hypothetical protein